MDGFVNCPFWLLILGNYVLFPWYNKIHNEVKSSNCCRVDEKNISSSESGACWRATLTSYNTLKVFIPSGSWSCKQGMENNKSDCFHNFLSKIYSFVMIFNWFWKMKVQKERNRSACWKGLCPKIIELGKLEAINNNKLLKATEALKECMGSLYSLFLHWSRKQVASILYNVSTTHIHDATLKVHSIYCLILCQETPKDFMQALI